MHIIVSITQKTWQLDERLDMLSLLLGPHVDAFFLNLGKIPENGGYMPVLAFNFKNIGANL